MNKRVGFIGCGKMAQAMIAGMIKSEILLQNEMIASAKTSNTITEVQKKYGIQITESNIEVAQFSTYLFLAVKPTLYSEIIKEIKDFVVDDTIIITIAAGIDLAFIEEQFGKKVKVVRSMPNTPSLVGEGMSAICHNEHVTEEELKDVITLFDSFGKCELVSESIMDSIPAISGSSPAYVYMLIEALADGGVRQGIDREQAYHLAAQAVLGAAKMVLETGVHPGELKDQVCTPGGATIEAVAALEENGFRHSILAAMEACTEKAVSLKK
ncbi:pyrroline-5-carboxylate reductase [Bacillus suaedaesalsae]|uniref:Pyrroline-5-carboxylate reductase n=1 Tax=Bacillus suaedaesalsae TaxID=2810349 RepID=A0ABS2DEY8_9BACI|nr:pyrroline-5-carboxylate reductase [Bacillus suaedaesalsae]MBM6617029.1 pyrroline-5-carboxylate reductase [Bacillus suaedaesalsae]